MLASRRVLSTDIGSYFRGGAARRCRRQHLGIPEDRPQMHENQMVPPTEVQLPQFSPAKDQRRPEIGVGALKVGHMASVAGWPTVVNLFSPSNRIYN
jgi:hypothetical protein